MENMFRPWFYGSQDPKSWLVRQWGYTVGGDLPIVTMSTRSKFHTVVKQKQILKVTMRKFGFEFFCLT